MKEPIEKDIIKVKEFTPLMGQWEQKDGIFTYIGPTKFPENLPNPPPVGLGLFKNSLINGSISAKIKFTKQCIARLVIGFDSKTGEYYSIGLGGYDYLYVVDKFEDQKGWGGLQLAGYKQKRELDKEYEVKVTINGQNIILTVNGVEIFNYRHFEPIKGRQTGLFTWGESGVEFSNVAIEGSEKGGKAFVIMEFDEPYKSIYEEVIEKICDEMNLFVYKADEVYTQGFILDDIIQGIAESEIIIADVTPKNENVFYELGFAHALKKPTILLAEKGTQLPFNISGYRVIFYSNTIKGKGEVEENLRKHLRNILQ